MHPRDRQRRSAHGNERLVPAYRLGSQETAMLSSYSVRQWTLAPRQGVKRQPQQQCSLLNRVYESYGSGCRTAVGQVARRTNKQDVGGKPMATIGRVESIWRYPVKSMRGEEIPQAFMGFSGLYGDRLYAFRDSGVQAGFPFLTGREQERMILYRPRFRHPQRSVFPPNLTEAEALAPGLTPVYADPSDMMVDVETPAHKAIPIDDPALLAELSEGLDEGHTLSLTRSDRAMTDCRPVSILSLQTVQQIGLEAGLTLDKRRFRANVFADLSMNGFAENDLLGRRLQIGQKAVIALVARDPRCKMITLDPDTAEASPQVLRVVAQAHGGNAGVYGAVLVEGVVGRGAEIKLLD